MFDYPYERIAPIVGKSEAATRQIATRARRHVDERRPRYEASERRRVELAERFFAAAREGELETLESLLAEDVELHGDGGGKVPALARALSGRNRVARTLVNWGRFGSRFEGVRVELTELNGQVGAVITGPDGVLGAMALEISGGRVLAIRSVVNPEKLTHL